MSKKFMIYFCAFLLLCFGLTLSTADAASLKISAFTFNHDSREDIMGPGGALTPDGKPDASFSLSVGGASAIKEITLKNEASGTEWSTNTPISFAALQGSDGEFINSSGRVTVLPVILGASYKLYISDADKEITKETSYIVTVKLVDGSALTAKAEAAPFKGALDERAKTDGITSVKSLGVSDYDLAGAGETLGADGKKDFGVKAALRFSDARVTGMKINVQNGTEKGEWDTLKGNNIPMLVVLDKNESIVNKADGSVSIAVAGTGEYTLLLQDNAGIFTRPGTNGTLTVALADGRVFEEKIEMGKITAVANTLTVEYKGKGRYDFVGENEKLASNLNADRQLDASLNASGTVSGVRIKAANGKIWDTIPGNSNWLTAVTNKKGEKLNNADGSVSIPISGPTDFSLWFEEDKAANEPFTVTFVLTNGQVIEATTAKTAEGKDPGGKATGGQEIKFLTAKPAPINLDIVGKNKKLAPNGAKDHSIKVQIKGSGQIVAIRMRDSTNFGWDTLPANNGRWRLAVREGNKTLNDSSGAIKIPVNGTRELTLVAQNNGNLSAAKGRLILEVSWSDAPVTSATLTW